MPGERFGYVFLVVLATIFCFWQFVCESSKPFNEEQKNNGLTKKKLNKELVKHAKKYWPIGAIGLGWLILIVSALCGDGVCLVLGLITTVIAILAIGYYFYGEEEKEGQFTAFKFLLVSLGLGFGLAIGVSWFKGPLAYLFGIAWAIIIPVTAHFVRKKSINDLEDEEEDSAPAPRVIAQPPRTTTQPPRATAQPPRISYRPPTTGQPVRRRHPDSSIRTDTGVDWNLDSHIVECLSKTKEGRQLLAEVLKSRS